jgi:hypothetical protein
MAHLDNILTSYINAAEKSEILRVCHEGSLANLKVDEIEMAGVGRYRRSASRPERWEAIESLERTVMTAGDTPSE